jgi:hypothetical protein
MSGNGHASLIGKAEKISFLPSKYSFGGKG